MIADMFQTERHFIMQVVCEATQCPDTRVSDFMTLMIQLNVYMFTVSWFVVLCVYTCVVCSGARGGLTEPGEDHVSVLSVHGDLHGSCSVRGETPPHGCLDLMFISFFILKFFIYTCIQRMSVFTVIETWISR